MAQTIQILIIILLCLSIVAVIRLWSVLGTARVTLANLEATRREADVTLKRLAEVAVSTDKVMREEVAPTLQRTRATLEHVEVTTRALAQTTQTISRLTGRAEGVTNAQRLFSLGGIVVQNVAQNVLGGKANKNGANTSHPASAATSLGFSVATAIASRLLVLFGRRGGGNAQAEARTKPALEQSGQPRTLPDAEYAGKTLTVGNGTPMDLLPEPLPIEMPLEKHRRKRS